MMKNVIKESTTQQLTEMYYELVQAISLRAAQGMGTDELLSETVAEVVAEMNARMSGGRDLQLPPAA
jgi:biotin carboxylase